jgi:hypothetical protein
MTDPLLRGLEHELTHLRYLRDAVLAILKNQQLAPTAKLEAIEDVVQAERDPDEEAEIDQYEPAAGAAPPVGTSLS